MLKRGRLLNVAIMVSAGLCVILLGVLAWLSFAPKSAVSEPMLYSAFFPEEIKNNSFRYYNGNSFYKYDLVTAKTTPLVADKYYLLENISSLYWLDSAVVFIVSDATPWSTLNQFDITEGPDSAVWYMSFSDGAVKQLDLDLEASNFSTSVYDSHDGLVVSANDGIKLIGNDGKVSSLFENSGLSGENVLHIVDYSSSSLLYTTPVNENYSVYRYDATSDKKELVLDGLVTNPASIENFSIYKSGDSVVYTDFVDVSDETTQNIIRYDMKNKDKSTLLSNFSGIVEQSAITKTGSSSISVYTDTNGSLNKIHTFDDLSSQPVHTECENEICYMFQRGGIVRAIAKESAQLTGIKQGYHDPLEKVIQSDTLYVTRNILSESDNEYSVAIADGQLQQRYKELVDLVESTQQNPAEFMFVLTAGRAVEY